MRRARSLTVRILLAEGLVILAGALTLLLVAIALAPGIFRSHVHRALGTLPANELRHLDQAFQDALLIALAAAVVVAVATAVTIGVVVAARVARPVRSLVDAARDLAAGNHDVRLSLAGASELRDAADAINALATSLARAEQSRRAFVSDTAHELRTPLTTIDGYLEGLEDGVVSPEPATWQLLRDQTTRLRRLVDDLTTLARADEGRLTLVKEHTDAGELARRAVAAAAPAYATKGVALDAPDTQPAPLLADPVRIDEILANLLANALRHTPPGGTVHVAVDASPDAHVQITVSDDGDGIAPNDLPHVFDRFYRSDTARARQHGGSGLGLAISRALTEAHHGTITARSDGAGAGASFTIELPPT